MKKQWMIKILFLVVSFVSNAQFGIGIKKPHENADIHLANKNRTIILNHVDDKTAITNPQDGMIFYDAVDKCYRGFADGFFTDCFGMKPSDPVVRVDGPGFKGAYVRGQELTDGTYEITVTNNTFKDVTLGFHINDLNISGVGITGNGGINVLAVYQAGSTDTDTDQFDLVFPAGAAKTIVYKLGGTPVAPYTQLLGEWNKITLAFDDVVDVGYILDCGNASWTQVITPMAYEGLRTNQSYSGEYTIEYIFDGDGFTFPAWSQTVEGLTLSALPTAGNSAGGQIKFLLSGTYIGGDYGNIEFNIYNKCGITIALQKSCNEILKMYPELKNNDGIYKIDVDGTGIGLAPMDCYCDMTTDGGGWTLVLNYNHKGGTNPDLLVRTYDLPILSNFALGTDESGTEYWGHFSNSLASKISFQQMRFYGETNNHNRKIHFKILKEFLPLAFDYVTGVNVSGSFQGVNQNFISLPSHNAFLPLDSPIGDQWSGYGDEALTRYPFFKKSTYHWTIKGDNTSYITNNRWEVDDSLPNGVEGHSKDTHHQVWIR